MEVLCIIWARGGSTRIPRKNLKKLDGVPLIGHAIKKAKSTKLINRVIVSTEDEEIAKVAKEYNAEVPFKRPLELTLDTATAVDIIQHVLNYLKKKNNYKPDIIVGLYATSPLLDCKYIDSGIKKLIKEDYDSVVSGCRTRPYYLWKKKGDKLTPQFKQRINSQDAEIMFRENGAFYIMTYDTVMKKNTITGKKTGMIIMDEMESIDIDEPIDFIIAETILNYNKNSKSYI